MHRIQSSLTFNAFPSLLSSRFLEDVEEGMEHTLSKGHTFLKGGEAALHVGADQDPKKMSLENIMNESNKK